MCQPLGGNDFFFLTLDIFMLVLIYSDVLKNCKMENICDRMSSLGGVLAAFLQEEGIPEHFHVSRFSRYKNLMVLLPCVCMGKNQGFARVLEGGS